MGGLETAIAPRAPAWDLKIPELVSYESSDEAVSCV